MLKKFAIILAFAFTVLDQAIAQGIDQVQPPNVGLSECSEEQLSGHDVLHWHFEHGQFSAPIISYQFGTNLTGTWGFYLSLLVDETGAIRCYRIVETEGKEFIVNAERKALIRQLTDWRYQPFMKDGKPAPIVIKEFVAEQELPQTHIALPTVPLEKIHLVLRRTACRYACPDYKIEIFGNGRVVYHGNQNVDVSGRHAWWITSDDVASLMQSLRDRDFWSIRKHCHIDCACPYIEGDSENILTLELGKESFMIGDSCGPDNTNFVVNEFEDEIDRATRVKNWIDSSPEARKRRKQEHLFRPSKK